MLCRRLVAETIGTAFLLMAIVGSGILGARLSSSNTAIALLANALATSAALYGLIEWLGPVSGAHFNPLVTFALMLRGEVEASIACRFALAQMIGALLGVAVANAMFDLALFSLSNHVRSGSSQWLSEFVATFGLIGAVWTCSRMRPSAVASVVATYIGAGFWFTATDFANPAVTVARAFTDTFSGIRLLDVPGFLIAETAGALAAVLVFRWLIPGRASSPSATPSACTANSG
jgi:glycerol uptake facilitator-like aquaporin